LKVRRTRKIAKSIRSTWRPRVHRPCPLVYNGQCLDGHNFATVRATITKLGQPIGEVSKAKCPKLVEITRKRFEIFTIQAINKRNFGVEFFELPDTKWNFVGTGDRAGRHRNYCAKKLVPRYQCFELFEVVFPRGTTNPHGPATSKFDISEAIRAASTKFWQVTEGSRRVQFTVQLWYNSKTLGDRLA
jgi:hypothetical protein